MACNASSHSLGLDLQNLAVLHVDVSSVMEATIPPFSSLETDISTGYLEDALVQFSERSKRRRLLMYSDHQTKVPTNLLESYWNSNFRWALYENFSYRSQITTSGGISDEPIISTTRTSEEGYIITEIKTPESAISAPDEAVDSSSSSYKDSVKKESLFDKYPNFSTDYMLHSSGGDKKNKRVITRLVYPFTLVKPGGAEGDVTLKEINERILMPPTRPLRHPVGDFACRPCVSAHGPGLSGKAVVALTRIHTQGTGTITIIRTKG
ncbi:hypothetical protein CFOL_v3_16715 [Cephalotus follicularis]|uniref:Protein XRI1 n=1 Tax=Cephalotus follicularis TaxID=3775 RepID=A0A1Q3BZB6_CEPFO|nr:hypothetical protein CFOL_v3_16715 [Cephalotus follicularis]